jgi:phenylalanyl-tRNA synthetase beta chain
VGQRPISALVDMTNYVMLSYGRPLHVYDVAKLQGALVARKARDGEELLALNGKTYSLEPSMTVIADDAHVHDIGGIMGGEESGVTEATTDILIECAYFDPETIARTGQKLGLASDARTRFERGVDPEFVDPGLALATGLAIELAGGEASEVIRAGSPPPLERTVSYRPQRCAELAGVAVPEERQRDILARLGFEVEQGETWQIKVPSWRRDVTGSADIVEEVVRIEGLDAIPSTPLPRTPGVARPTATASSCSSARCGAARPPAASTKPSPGASSARRKPLRSAEARGSSTIRSARR